MKLFCLLIVLVIVACGDGKHMPVDNFEQQQDSGEPAGDSSDEALITFEEHIKPLFIQYCNLCHIPGSGLPVWTNYQESKNKLQSLMDRVVIRKDMPPPGLPSPTDLEITMIKTWIEDGGPL